MRTRGLRATRLTFLISGQAAATWAPLVPFLKGRLGIDDGALGLVILCLGLGSVATMPVAGGLVARFGARRVAAAGGLGIAAALPAVAFAASLAALAGAVACFGAALGALDVAMNTEAVLVERHAGRPLMSGIHAFYSLGGAAGSAAMTLLLEAGVGPAPATIASACLAVLLLGAALGDFLPDAGGAAREAGEPRLARPDAVALGLGALCMISFLAEGAVADWGALFLTARHGLPARAGGLAYGVFSGAMVAGRLAGDRLVARFGGATVLTAGALAASAGYGLSILPIRGTPVLAAFALIGFGAANIVPVLVTASGRSRLSPGLAVATVTTLGYGGVLLGPAALGFVSRASNLSVSFACVGALLVVVALRPGLRVGPAADRRPLEPAT